MISRGLINSIKHFIVHSFYKLVRSKCKMIVSCSMISDRQNGNNSKIELFGDSHCQHGRAPNICSTMDGKSKDVTYERSFTNI